MKPRWERRKAVFRSARSSPTGSPRWLSRVQVPSPALKLEAEAMGLGFYALWSESCDPDRGRGTESQPHGQRSYVPQYGNRRTGTWRTPGHKRFPWRDPRLSLPEPRNEREYEPRATALLHQRSGPIELHAGGMRFRVAGAQQLAPSDARPQGARDNAGAGNCDTLPKQTEGASQRPAAKMRADFTDSGRRGSQHVTRGVPHRSNCASTIGTSRHDLQIHHPESRGWFH